MLRLLITRNYTTRYNTWCYRQGLYQYKKNNKEDQYYPLICKFKDVPVANKTFAKEIGAQWDKDEKKWVIVRKFNQT